MTTFGRQDPGEPYRRVSVEEAARILQNMDSVAVDVRNQDEWEAGHVKNALHIPVDDVINRIHELPQDKNLLFICAMGVRSGLACEMAAAMGIPINQLYNIEEGTPTWIEKGLPTEYGK